MRILYLALILMVLMPVAHVSAETVTTVFLIDGRQVDLTYPPEMKSKDMLVWVGDLVRLGWVTIQEQKQGKIVLKRNDVTLTFKHKQQIAWVNNLVIEISEPAEIISGRFMVPFGFTCKSFGFSCSLKQALVVEANTSAKTTAAVLETGINSIQGTVVYNGHPVAGIKVRLVNDKNEFLPVDPSVTDEQGVYLFNNLPEGKFRTLVYVADNPDYFNCSCNMLILKDGVVANASQMDLTRVLHPETPKIGQDVSTTSGLVEFSWTECPEAAKYQVTIINTANKKTVLTQTTTKPALEIPASKLVDGNIYQWSVMALDKAGKYLGGSPISGGVSWTFKFVNKKKMYDV